MRRFAACMLASAVVFCAIVAAPGVRPVAAADEEQAPLQAGQALAKAIEKADRTAAGALLDADFEWTNVDGKTRTKAETLQNLTALAAGNEGDTEVKTFDYGQVERIAEIHHKTHFVRIGLWVKRPAGWRAFIYLDTPIPASAPHPTRPKEADKNCENPCKSLPYKPTTATQQAVIDAWLKLKIDEWQAIPDDWKTHVSESMVVTSPSMLLDKAGRLALLTQQKEAYGTGSPSAPVVSMGLFEFGNAVIMTALHGPNAAGKPSYAVRIFVNEGGDWKIALSAQTDIKQPASTSNQD